MDVDSDSSFMATHDAKQQNYAKFYLQPVLNRAKSKEAGREIWENKEFILILCPGQTKSEFRAPVQERHKREYAQAWADFQNGQKEPTVSGTPIEYLPGMNPARAKELRAVNIYTIEQMAGCPDTAMRAVGMDFNSLKNRANAYIGKVSPEVESLRVEVAELKKLLAQVEPKKPGRPRKTESPTQVSA